LKIVGKKNGAFGPLLFPFILLIVFEVVFTNNKPRLSKLINLFIIKVNQFKCVFLEIFKILVGMPLLKTATSIDPF